MKYIVKEVKQNHGFRVDGSRLMYSSGLALAKAELPKGFKGDFFETEEEAVAYIEETLGGDFRLAYDRSQGVETSSLVKKLVAWGEKGLADLLSYKPYHEIPEVEKIYAKSIRLSASDLKKIFSEFRQSSKLCLYEGWKREDAVALDELFYQEYKSCGIGFEEKGIFERFYLEAIDHVEETLASARELSEDLFEEILEKLRKSDEAYDIALRKAVDEFIGIKGNGWLWYTDGGKEMITDIFCQEVGLANDLEVAMEKGDVSPQDLRDVRGLTDSQASPCYWEDKDAEAIGNAFLLAEALDMGIGEMVEARDITAKREEMKLSKNALGEESEIGSLAVSNFEKGRYSSLLKRFLAVCEMLEVEPTATTILARPRSARS